MSLASCPVVRPRMIAPRRPVIARTAQRGKAMTIAAGFVFDGGFILSADTKITRAIKTDESKLDYRVFDGKRCEVCTAFSASDVSYARAAVQVCLDAVSQSPVSSVHSVRRTFETALADFYRRQIFSHFEPRAVSFELLVGIRVDQDCQLFASSETLLNPVESYACIGAGGYLGNYCAREFLRANDDPDQMLTRSEAELIARYVVNRACDFDEGCGVAGEPESILIAREGVPKYDSVDYPPEMVPEHLQTAMWQMLRGMSLVDRDNLSEQSDALLEVFFERVREIVESAKTCSDFSDLLDGD